MTGPDLAAALSGLPPGGWVELWAPAASAAWIEAVVGCALAEVPEGRKRLRVGTSAASWALGGLGAARKGWDGSTIWPDVWAIGRRRAGRPNVETPRLPGICAHPACRLPLPPRKRAWCNPWCATQWLAWFDWGLMAGVVLERDGLLCAICECDVRPGDRVAPTWWRRKDALECQARDALKLDTREADIEALAARDALRALLALSVAHVDHIRPVRYGGDAWDPANLRVLCPTCHAAQRRPQRERWADEWEAMRRADPWLVVRAGTELWVPLTGRDGAA